MVNPARRLAWFISSSSVTGTARPTVFPGVPRLRMSTLDTIDDGPLTGGMPFTDIKFLGSCCPPKVRAMFRPFRVMPSSGWSRLFSAAAVEYDVVVVGGGPGGYVAAIKAGQLGLKVCPSHSPTPSCFYPWTCLTRRCFVNLPRDFKFLQFVEPSASHMLLVGVFLASAPLLHRPPAWSTEAHWGEPV